MDVAVFDVGQVVRVLKAPHENKAAAITALPQRVVRFPSGLRAPGAEVEFEDGEKSLVPLANIEVIG